MKNWIKTHRRHTAALFGLFLVILGIICLLPKSPWTLIISGITIAIGAGISAIDPDFE